MLSALIKQLIKLGKVWQQGINVSPATREEVALNHSEQVDGQTATEGGDGTGADGTGDRYLATYI